MKLRENDGYPFYLDGELVGDVLSWKSKLELRKSASLLFCRGEYSTLHESS